MRGANAANMAATGLYAFLPMRLNFAEQFTGRKGQYVTIPETIKGFKMILNGELDNRSENDFYMKGSIETLDKAS